MASLSEDIIDQAVAWHVRAAELTDAEWRQFVDWLEADARHTQAYDQVSALDDLVDRHLDRPAAQPVRTDWAGARTRVAPRWSRWAGAGAAMAAAVAAIIVLQPAGQDLHTISTGAGETRRLTLADGTLIEMSGGTRLTLDRNDNRYAALDRGEALFHVRHDAKAPFAVHVGDHIVQDLGTVFDIRREGKGLEVQVAEGAVMFEPTEAAVRLGPGFALALREGSRDVEVSRVSVDLVGGWRSGRLAFQGEPILDVAQRLGRLYGTEIRVDSRLSAINVTGIVTLSGEAKRDVPYLASLVGAAWHKDGERWILSPKESITP